jgi:hypothetical protein
VLSWSVHRRIAPVAAVFALALLAGCATPAPQIDAIATAAPLVATAAPAVAAEWSSFTEPILGYTIRYPRDTVITSGVSPAGVYTTRLQFRVPGVDGYQGMVIRVEPNPEGRGLEEVIPQLYEDYLLGEAPEDLLAGLPRQTIAGLTAAQVGSGGDFSLVLPIGDVVYVIAPVHDLTTTSIDPQALELFYQILSTMQVAP